MQQEQKSKKMSTGKKVLWAAIALAAAAVIFFAGLLLQGTLHGYHNNHRQPYSVSCRDSVPSDNLIYLIISFASLLFW